MPKPTAKNTEAFQTLRRQQLVTNAYLMRSQLMKQMLDGAKRDLNEVCGYPEAITIEMYKAMYDRGGPAKRVVHCEPEESWALDPEVYEVEEGEETVFEKAWRALEKQLNLYHYLQRADVMSGIGEFGILLLGLDDGKELSEPVDGIDEKGERTGKKAYSLLYLRVFDESVVTITTRQTDKTNPRYGQPTMYQVRFQDTSVAGSTAGTGVELVTRNVHWSRVIHFADGRTMSEVFGTPRMQPVYDRLFDIRKVASSSGEMYWRGAFPGYSFEVDKEIAEGGGEMDGESLKAQIDAYVNDLQRYIAIQGMHTNQLSPQVVDPTPNVEMQLKLIAITLGIPFRILFGSERGELASSQDADAWNIRLKRRQSKYVSPLIIQPTVDRLVKLGCLPEPKEVNVFWPDLTAPKEADKADVAVKRTQALAAYVTGGVENLVKPKEYFTQFMDMTEKEADAALGSVAQDEQPLPDGTQMPTPPDGTAPVDGTQTASMFNGAQVQAAAQIVKDVTAGVLPRESGLGQLKVFFGLTDEQAAEVMGTAGTTTPVKPNPGAADGQPPSKGGQKPPFDGTANFDPNQPRDEHGKWTDGGSTEADWRDKPITQQTVEHLLRDYGSRANTPPAHKWALSRVIQVKVGKNPNAPSTGGHQVMAVTLDGTLFVNDKSMFDTVTGTDGVSHKTEELLTTRTEGDLRHELSHLVFEQVKTSPEGKAFIEQVKKDSSKELLVTSYTEAIRGAYKTGKIDLNRFAHETFAEWSRFGPKTLDRFGPSLTPQRDAYKKLLEKANKTLIPPPTTNYDPNQARDEHGRWTDEGGGSLPTGETGPGYPIPPKGIDPRGEAIWRERGRAYQRFHDKNISEEERAKRGVIFKEVDARFAAAKQEHPEWFKPSNPNPEPKPPVEPKPEPKPEPVTKTEGNQSRTAEDIHKWFVSSPEMVAVTAALGRYYQAETAWGEVRRTNTKAVMALDEAAEAAWKAQEKPVHYGWGEYAKFRDTEPSLQKFREAVVQTQADYERAWSKYRDAKTELKAQQGVMRNRLFKELTADKPLDEARTLVKSAKGEEVQSKSNKEVEKAVRLFGSICEDSAWTQPGSVVLLTDVKLGRGGRSNCSWYGDRIYLAKRDCSNPTTTFHELGHALEARNPVLHQQLVDFLKRRTEGEALQPLRKLVKGSGYRKDEMARPDKFMDPYIGKDYQGKATEVLSMGLQLIHTRPMDFALRDPEHFKLTVRALRGEIK